eukprot:TRINITY_DN2863_c1_g1_i1.p1 TRINITY_DN2863_c1_g1~~TRINITY_DN2863_c1_g1_i1.p1  ORF type:complete len:342 (+),score=76.70 TRINITY_DN2863_c1_g1_i1:22-1026(+)
MEVVMGVTSFIVIATTCYRLVTQTQTVASKLNRYAGIEGGGTSFVVSIAEGSPENIVDQYEFDTSDPDTTVQLLLNWLSDQQFDALGVASFGPIDLHVGSPTYGYITTTPKPQWNMVDLLGPLQSQFPNIPIGFDTDVNAAVLAEQLWAKNNEEILSDIAYITVGTGIGVGIMSGGNLLHGMLHPEGGHMCVKRRIDDNFEGVCPFHQDCVEGLAAAGSIAKRLNISSKELKNVDDENPVWDIIGYYLAQLCVNLILTISPEKIVFGGGILKRKVLINHIRYHVIDILNDYIKTSQLESLRNLSSYVVLSGWQEDSGAGAIGSLILAQIASNKL